MINLHAKLQLNKINTASKSWFQKIQWAQVYLAVVGAIHRVIVEQPRKWTATRQQQADLPVSQIRQLPLQAGDILYTPSSESTYYAGHMGILGEDGKVYHVHPYGPVFSDSVEWYVKRFYDQDRFIVFRPQSAEAGQAAALWAQEHYQQVQAYRLNTNLDQIERSYCSKFIYQAYLFTSGINVWPRPLKLGNHGYIYPFRIMRSKQLKIVESFYRG